MTIKPYANESDSLAIGDLTVENRTDRISIYGSLDLTRDKHGLQYARTLKALLDTVVAALVGDKHLPDQVALPEKPDEVKNPFA